MPKNKFPHAGTDHRPEHIRRAELNTLADMELDYTQPKGRGAGGTNLSEDLPARKPLDRNQYPTSVFFPDVIWP